ncbi:MAG: hypothetical protein M0Z26_00125 [Acidithiobacillus sp.]|nr:hypothetical protein [Acidithiobacillus sp.]
MTGPFTHQYVALQVADQCCPLDGIAIDLRSTVVQIHHTLRRIGLIFSIGELVRAADLTQPILRQNLELEVPHVLH